MPLRDPAVIPNPGTAGVGLIHALSLAGVPMITVGRNWPPLLGRFSRFPKRHFTYRPSGGETLTGALLRVAGEFEGKGVLFPHIDMDLEPIVADRQRLAERYHVPAAPHIGEKIFAKNWQYELAREAGVPIPRHTRFVAGASPGLAGFRYPLILKPSSRTEADGGRVFRLKVLDDEAALGACLAELARDFPAREFQLAENIPGDPTRLYTVGAYSDREGRVLRTYTGRKVSQHPYTHGDASIAETIAPDERVVGQTRRLLEKARFHGISQVEFKYDARDDEYKLLEINGRSWSWIKLPAYSGVNLPLIQYYDLTGDPRLEGTLASPQRDDRFLVRDALIKLNRLPLERRLIAELKRRKTLVSAIQDERDPKLAWIHRLALLAMSLPGGKALGVG